MNVGTKGRVIVAGSFATLLLLGSAAAAPGDLDPTFGSGGIVRTAVGPGAAQATGLALQPDGKIVLAGLASPEGLPLARYASDGTLDSTFGTGGVITGPQVAGLATAVQPDGKIVVAGRFRDSDFALVRYTADGDLDTGFGQSGVAIGPPGQAQAVAIQPNGQIVVAGFALDPERAELNAFTLARFYANGTPDLGFGSSGVVRTRIGTVAGAFAVALQPDGRIVAAGYSTPDASPPYVAMALARYMPNGALDREFGADGVVSTPIVAGFRGGTSVALQPDGRIVAAGNTDNDFAVARYDRTGELDVSFDKDGIATAQVGPAASATALALQADGGIVVAGAVDDAFALTRFQPDGDVDTGFGDGGVLSTRIGLQSGVRALAIQPDGRILAAGYSSDESSTRFALARYLVTTPTTIEGDPLVVDFGNPIRVQGTLTGEQPGASVLLVRKDCYALSARSGPALVTDGAGGWALRLRPQSRTDVWVKVGAERSSRVTVRVRPRVTIGRLRGRRVAAKVVFARSLAGSSVVLQSYNPAAKHWLDEKERYLRRLSGRPPKVVSGVTVRLPPARGKWFRFLLRQTNPYACYATASSGAIRG